jgi:hypothetical protein
VFVGLKYILLESEIFGSLTISFAAIWMKKAQKEKRGE